MSVSNNKYVNMWSLLDITFVLLLLVVMQFIILLAILKTDDAPPAIVDKNQYIIKMEWTDGANADVDMWVMDPAKSTVSYRTKEGNGLFLQRDDFGADNDEIVTGDGTTVISTLNEEIINIRQINPGRYYVNAHMYNNKDDSVVDVKMTLIQVTPFQQWDTETVSLHLTGSEKTLLTFDIDVSGGVTIKPQIQNHFVAQARSLEATTGDGQ